MRLTKFGHACVRLDADSAGVGAIVVDPGSFTDVAVVVRGASYLFVTHDHADHLDVGAVTAALRADPGLRLFGNASVMAALLPAGAPAAQLWEVSPGSPGAVRQGGPSAAGGSADAEGPAAAGGPADAGGWEQCPWGGWQVLVGGGWHAPVHPLLPRARNCTYLFLQDDGAVYHPGDSFDLPNLPRPAGAADAGPPRELDVLCVPVSGPWQKLGDGIDFLRAAQPRIVVPIHDALNSEAGNKLCQARLSDPALVGQAQCRPLAVGESLIVG